MIYRVFTDGATSNNGQEGAKGGWGFAIYDEEGLVISGSGYAYDTTNNKMELKAIIEGLAAVRLLIESDDFNSIYVFSDSAYCVNCVEQKWYAKWQKNGWCNSKKEPVKNKELWEQLIPYFENPQFFFKKVKGHSGIEENEYVDKLAREAIITLREGGLD